VEWTLETGRLYVLDSECEPLTDVQISSFHVQSDEGPRPVELRPCPGSEAPCFTAGAGFLERAETSGVLRLGIQGKPCRVLIAMPTTTTEPAIDLTATSTSGS
jgi:hypothetical protein